VGQNAAATGKAVDEEGLNQMGEMVFNLCRAILAREGHKGRESDVLPEIFYARPFEAKLPLDYSGLVPGRGGEVIYRKGAVIDREKFEEMKDEYYRLRRWDVASGLQTKARLKELGLEEVARGLERQGLAV
jgi:aldehyde:ferredoxin oxidoreductase